MLSALKKRNDTETSLFKRDFASHELIKHKWKSFRCKRKLNFCRGWKFHVIEKKFCNVATASGVENVGRESSYIENAGGGGGGGGEMSIFSFLCHVCLTKYASFSETSAQPENLTLRRNNNLMSCKLIWYSRWYLFTWFRQVLDFCEWKAPSHSLESNEHHAEVLKSWWLIQLFHLAVIMKTEIILFLLKRKFLCA